jgi:carboxypeptidase D
MRFDPNHNMRRGLAIVLAVASAFGPVSAIAVDSIEHRNGESASSKISFVKNSGICETTPDVDQYSGYVDVGQDMNMWFW